MRHARDAAGAAGITAVNGEALASAEQVLELVTKLRDATALHVDIERRGQPIALDDAVK